MQKDYYLTLGVLRGATQEEIKKAYRKMAMEFHPDRNPGKEKWANEKFKEINEAFSILGDCDKKSRYDHMGFATRSASGSPFRRPTTRTGVEDMMKDFGTSGIDFDFLEHIFGDAPASRSYSSRKFGRSGRVNFDTWQSEVDHVFGGSPAARTVRYELLLNMREARRGVVKYLSRNGKNLEVTIPKSVKTGSVVKLTNALKVTDGFPGDILIKIKVHRV